MTEARTARLLTLLSELETNLQENGLWDEQGLSDAELTRALNSSVPFSYDHLRFEQWLQFVFLPRIKLIAQTDSVIPPMDITPAAEVCLAKEHTSLFNVLAQIDALSKPSATHG